MVTSNLTLKKMVNPEEVSKHKKSRDKPAHIYFTISTIQFQE